MSENRHSAIGIHGLHSHEGARGFNRIRLLKRTQRVALLIICILLIGAAIVVALRFVKGNALAETSNEQQTRYVNVTTPKVADASNTLNLPGTLQGVIQASIFARTSGYVTGWYKDIGAQVKQGELLAQIDAPEFVQQLNEAKAAQAQAVTNLQLAQISFDRWDALRKRDAVSQQEVDERRNALTFAAAANTSAKATVQRLQDQVGYSRVVAPFSGVVTSRNIDIGNLIDAGGGTRVLFTMAKSDTLRAYIYVPQSYAAQIQVGAKVNVTLKEMPGQTFEATITRTAGAIDTVTRTLQVEIRLPNADGKLLPGAYVQAAIKTKGGEASSMRVPSNVLLFRPEGLRAAVVGADNKVHLQPVTIARELGVDVEVVGLKANDQVIVNPSDSLNEGDMVNVAAAKEKTDKPATGKAADATVAPTADKNKGSAS